MTPTNLFGDAAWSGIGADNWDGFARPDDIRLTSASSVVRVMAAPALEKWMIDQTAEVTVDNLSLVNDILISQGREQAVRWVQQARWKPRDGAALGAAATGTLIHEFIECWGRGTKLPAEQLAIVDTDPIIRAMLDRAWDWFSHYQPEFLCAEATVFDPANGIAGRFDAHWRIPGLGDRVLVDVKTTRDSVTTSGNKKRPYPDQHALQLAIYRHAPLMAPFESRTTGKDGDGPRFYLLNALETEACEATPTIDETAILHITPTACALYPVATGPEVHAYALAAAQLHRWLYSVSRKAINGYWGEETVA